MHATLDPAVISCDPVLAERLIANLVGNAASQLTVANTGPVISPADAGRIFEPFQRLSEPHLP